MTSIIAFLVGLIFSFGLVISEMINPNKVIGFLDIFGLWDPTLVFVMASAVIFNLLSFKFILKRKPIFDDDFSLSTFKSLDWKLFIGAALFGVGWGIIGICPGPGIVNLVTLNPKILVFIISMLLGMILEKLFKKYSKI